MLKHEVVWEWLVRVLLDGSAEGRVLGKWGCSMANLGGALSETIRVTLV